MNTKIYENENLTYIVVFVFALLIYILCLPAIWLIKFFSYINKHNKHK